MDPRSKAKFINSVTSAHIEPSGNDAPAFQTITDDLSNPEEHEENHKERLNKQKLRRHKSRNDRTTEMYEEPESVFASGLPSWDILPPQIMVRRKS